MISILFSFPLLFGWLTDEMIQQKERQEEQANQVQKPLGKQKLPVNSPPPAANRRETLANEPGTTERGVRTNAANQQVLYWLSLNDQRQYRASWTAASTFLQDVISKDQWAAAMDAERSNLGSVHARKMIDEKKLTQLPHGTKGNFKQISYQTQFSKSGNTTEVITLMLEGKSGQWKVLSYRIEK